MSNLEQFSDNQEQKKICKTDTSDTWESKNISEQIIELEKQLTEINEEIHKIEHPMHLSYFRKVLNSIGAEDKRNKLTNLYHKRHATEAMLEKMKGDKTIH